MSQSKIIGSNVIGSNVIGSKLTGSKLTGSKLTGSNPTACDLNLPDVDPRIGLMFTSAEHLIPLFKTDAVDTPLAREMAASAIEAYQPESRADFVNVARTIAFSMAALALLGSAASEDMPLAAKMRAFGRANALNRSADQSERTMMQRRRYQQAGASVDRPNPQAAAAAPDPDMDDAEMQARIADVMKEYLATGPAAKATSHTTKAAPEPSLGPAPQTVKPAPLPPRTVSPIDKAAAAPTLAIHHNRSRSAADQPGTTAYRIKAALLGQGAMQRGVMLDGADQTR